MPEPDYRQSDVTGQKWRRSCHGEFDNAIMPFSRYGNCWTYALPRWWRHGGYLAIRRADGVGLCRFLPVPHAIWISRLARRGNVMRQFVPVKRRQTVCCPMFVGYYAGEVRSVESPHDAVTQEQ